MEIKILKRNKENLEIEIDNLTVVELLRGMLWQNKNTEIAAWKQEHPIKNPVLILKAKNPDKVLLNALKNIQDINSEVLTAFKQAFKK